MINATAKTAMWLRHNHMKECLDTVYTADDLKALIWRKCKRYVRDVEKFKRGQRLVHHENIAKAICQIREEKK